MMIVFIFIGLVIIYLILNTSAIAIRNHKAHQFFKYNSPKLPVLPNPNIFYGHLFETIRQEKNWKVIGELHDKYGISFGYYMCNQAYISTKDLDLLKLIEIDHAQQHINRSKLGLPFEEFNTSIFLMLDDRWRTVRRAIAPAFTNHKVRSDEVSSDIKQIIKELHESLERKMKLKEIETGSRELQLDVTDMSHRYTLAVIFLIIYNTSNVIDFDADEDNWTRVMEAGAKDILNPLVSVAIMFPFLRSTVSLLTKFTRVGNTVTKIIEYIMKASNKNREARDKQQKVSKLLNNIKENSFSEVTESEKRRLVDSIIEVFMDKKINYNDFISTMFFMLIAGFETTAGTITCLMWQLAHHPDIQEKLRDVIVKEGIDADYVMWCILEIVRWHPAVPLGTGRILTEDIELNGFLYPKGAFIMPSTYSIHHDKKVWPDPDAFKPERWRDTSDHHPAAFMGFGLGPRNCLGGKLAVYEMKLMLQMLLTNYRIEKNHQTASEYSFSSPGLVYTYPDQPISINLVSLE